MLPGVFLTYNLALEGLLAKMVLKERWHLGCLRKLYMTGMRTPSHKKKEEKKGRTWPRQLKRR